MGRKAKDLTGQKFGMLTAIAPTDRRINKHIVWECLCDCGNISYVSNNNLISKSTNSCGCNRVNDLTGQKFGKLTAIAPTDRRAGASIVWQCLCECGNTSYVNNGDLGSGNTKSCGCNKVNDLTGQRFSKLTAIAPTDRRSCNRIVWECICECGNTAYVSSNSLISKATNSCGCSARIRQPEILGYTQSRFERTSDIIVKSEEHIRIGRSNYFFDIAIIKGDTTIAFIEYDGEGHFMPVRFNGISEKKAESAYKNTVKSDKEKNKYCAKNNIPLCRIPYTDFDNYKTIIDRFLRRERLL